VKGSISTPQLYEGIKTLSPDVSFKACMAPAIAYLALKTKHFRAWLKGNMLFAFSLAHSISLKLIDGTPLI
jgi:hypothetical protein